jgi:hypothetical protein
MVICSPFHEKCTPLSLFESFYNFSFFVWIVILQNKDKRTNKKKMNAPFSWKWEHINKTIEKYTHMYMRSLIIIILNKKKTKMKQFSVFFSSLFEESRERRKRRAQENLYIAPPTQGNSLRLSDWQ